MSLSNQKVRSIEIRIALNEAVTAKVEVLASDGTVQALNKVLQRLEPVAHGERQNGFYWVVRKAVHAGNPFRMQVAFWYGFHKAWKIIGHEVEFTDEHMAYIGERLTAPEDPTLAH